jgi:hypothetical protein
MNCKFENSNFEWHETKGSLHYDFLRTIGYEKYKNTDCYVLAPDSNHKRKTIMEDITKGFTHYLSKTDLKESFAFKHLRKTFATSVNMSFGDKAHLITDHEEMNVMKRHYIDKGIMQEEMRNGFKIFKK